MKFIGNDKVIKVATGVVLTGAALFLTREALAIDDDCPTGTTVNCGNPGYGPSGWCYGNGTPIGHVECKNQVTMPLFVQGTGKLVATSTLNVTGDATCTSIGGVPHHMSWSTSNHPTQQNPDPVTVLATCSGTISLASCHGIHSPVQCD